MGNLLTDKRFICLYLGQLDLETESRFWKCNFDYRAPAAALHTDNLQIAFKHQLLNLELSTTLADLCVNWTTVVLIRGRCNQFGKIVTCRFDSLSLKSDEMMRIADTGMIFYRILEG